ncbi:Polygalacturonase [Paraphaeosphaeria minitans]
MVSVKISALLLGAGALVSAAPAPTPTQAAQLKDRAASCTFSGANGAASASKSKASCATIVLSNVAVPSGTTLDLTGLNSGTTLIFEGTTSFGYKEWEGPLISVSGTKVTVKGASGHVIDGNGARWWDGKGSNSGKTKPKLFSAHSMKQSTISNLNIKNMPVQGFSINSATDLTLDHITIDNSAGDGTAKNTDAFDVGSSSGITISNANIKNQDDCLAINSGTNIHFVGGTCSGGHGLSIGSVGSRSDNTVDGVVIENSSISDSQNGVRVKTIYGATGKVTNVTYKDITLSNISKYGVVLEQDYENGSPTGTATNGVPITDLTLSGVKGSVASSATPVYILCGKGSCSDWKWGVAVTGGKKSTKCTNVPSGASC